MTVTIETDTYRTMQDEARRLKREIADLEVKQKRLQAIKAYLSTFPEQNDTDEREKSLDVDTRASLPPATAADFPEFPHTRPKTRRILQAAYSVLQEHNGGPVRTRELVQRLTDSGIEIGGQDPVGTLSAAMSHNREIFQNRGRNAGWALAPDPNSED